MDTARFISSPVVPAKTAQRILKDVPAVTRAAAALFPRPSVAIEYI